MWNESFIIIYFICKARDVSSKKQVMSSGWYVMWSGFHKWIFFFKGTFSLRMLKEIPRNYVFSNLFFPSSSNDDQQTLITKKKICENAIQTNTQHKMMFVVNNDKSDEEIQCFCVKLCKMIIVKKFTINIGISEKTHQLVQLLCHLTKTRI